MTKTKPISVILYTACISIILYWVVHRMLLSVELTDETHGIASIINIIQGNKPFTTSWDYHTGWCLLAPIYSVFIRIQGSHEGIVLFSRIFYLCVVMVIAILIVALKYHREKNILSLALLGIVAWTPFSVFQLNYNSLTVLLLLAAVSILVGHEFNADYAMLLPGILFGLACINYPTMAVVTAITAVVIFVVYRKEGGGKKTTYFSMGVAFVGIIFALWVMHGNSIEDLKNGIAGMLSSPHEQSKGVIDSAYLLKTFRDPVKSYFETNNYVLLFLSAEFLVWLVLRLINRRAICKNTDKVTNILSFSSICLFIIYAIYLCYFYRPEVEEKFFSFNLFLAASIWVFFDGSLRIKKYLPYILLELAFVISYGFTSDNKDVLLGFTICNVITATVGMLGLIDWAVIQIKTGQSKAKELILNPVIFALCLSLFMIPGVLCSYNFVYRDAPVEQLTTKVSSGIYKGLYTTEDRAEFVVQFEDYIRSQTSPEESICVVTREPMAYVMSDSQILSSQTWDPQFLYRGNTSAEPLLSYYEAMGDVYPDKIIATNSAPADFFDNPNYEIKSFIEDNYDVYSSEEIQNVKVCIWQRKTG